jgi:hypothetical protein
MMSAALILGLLLQATAPPQRPAASTADLPAWSKTPSVDEMNASWPQEALRVNFGLAGGAGRGDFSGDGVIDFVDFQILERQFGRRLPQPAAAKAVAPVAGSRKSSPRAAPVARPPSTVVGFSTTRVLAR